MAISDALPLEAACPGSHTGLYEAHSPPTYDMSEKSDDPPLSYSLIGDLTHFPGTFLGRRYSSALFSELSGPNYTKLEGA